jgi:hypothetical protein
MLISDMGSFDTIESKRSKKYRKQEDEATELVMGCLKQQLEFRDQDSLESNDERGY